MVLSRFGRGAMRFIQSDKEDEEAVIAVEDTGKINQPKNRHLAEKCFKGCLLLILLVLLALCLATAVMLGKSHLAGFSEFC